MWAAALGLSLAPARARGDDPRARRELFFGLAVGGGVAWTEHPEVSTDPRAGVTWDIVFGWRLAERWALSVALTTWQTTFLGTPYHLHTLAPRVELNPLGREGPFLLGGFGLGMVDGDVSKRAGLAVTSAAGWRWGLGRGVTLSAQAGILAQWDVLFGDGGRAVEPFGALELRFHGRIVP